MRKQKLASRTSLGTSVRASPTETLSCFSPLCTFANPSLDRLQEHVQKEHNNNNKLLVDVLQFSFIQDSSDPDPTKVDDSDNLADEELSSDVAGPSSLGPIRGRPPHLQIRTTPYERTGDSSSRSSSPSRRTLFATHSPHGHLAPSPLNQLAYSRSNSPSPPESDDEMNVDDPELPLDHALLPFNEEEVLARASYNITTLSHLQTSPPTQLLTCTKCLHGVKPSMLITHSSGHRIKLLPAEKDSLKRIIGTSSFLDDANENHSPTPPCPPIEGILVQDGFSCNICTHCCTSFRSMQTHFSAKHKGVAGFAKANSKSVQVQALFPQRPTYFAVTPILRGLGQDDLFTVYLQQCAPEIDNLRILNPPLNPNEISPLLKIMQWHEHLKDHLSDRDKVRKLLELTTLPTSQRGEPWMGTPLRDTIDAYMRNVRVKANNTSLGIRCLLKECPRYISSLITSYVRVQCL